MYLIPQGHEMINDVSFAYGCSFRKTGEPRNHYLPFSTSLPSLSYRNCQVLYIFKAKLVVTTDIWEVGWSRLTMKERSPWNGRNIPRKVSRINLHLKNPRTRRRVVRSPGRWLFRCYWLMWYVVGYWFSQFPHIYPRIRGCCISIRLFSFIPLFYPMS